MSQLKELLCPLIPEVTFSIVAIHIFDISLNKCCYYIANIVHTCIILNGHMDPMPKHTHTHTTSCNIYLTSYYQICARNKYATKFSIYLPHMPSIWWAYMGGWMCICMPHMKSLAPTLWPGALYTNNADDNGDITLCLLGYLRPWGQTNQNLDSCTPV